MSDKKSKAKLFQMLAEAVRNTQPQPVNTQTNPRCANCAEAPQQTTRAQARSQNQKSSPLKAVMVSEVGMKKGCKFVGEFKRGRKARLLIECIVAVSDLEEAKAIASKKLVGADQITAKELSRAQMRALNLKEGDVRL